MRSPKLGASAAQYYRYYAGYTPGFVEDILQQLNAPKDGLVADPWNGGGTTTAAALAAGMSTVGFDINPAAVLIGRARLLGADVAESLVPLAVEICHSAKARPYVGSLGADLLETWFGPSTSRDLRSIERSIYRTLVDEATPAWVLRYDASLPQTSLASVFYVALFRAVRQLAHRFVPSNPTWIKTPDGKRIGATTSELHAAFVSAVRLSDPRRGQLTLTQSSAVEASATIAVASSTALPLDDASVAAAITSPPYCTRIDYVKATLPELAVLGLTEADVRVLRDRMIGTPTMSGTAEQFDSAAWGTRTHDFIEAVSAHESRASNTYYRKYFRQYFGGMWNSLGELHRVVQPGRAAVLVVQDSYYKELHIDLPGLIGDMAEHGGWSECKRVDFDVPKTLAAINPRSRRYRSDFRAVESAVVLTR